MMERSQRAAAIALSFLILPAQAVALSCARPSLSVLINYAEDAGAPMVIGYGSLRHEGPLPDNPSASYEHGKTGEAGIVSTGPVRTIYRFDGDVLTAEGHLNDQSFDVAVTAICVASWCGALPGPVVDGLIALSPSDAGAEVPYALTVSPCPGGIDTAPTPRKLKALRRCLANGHCSHKEHVAFDN